MNARCESWAVTTRPSSSAPECWSRPRASFASPPSTSASTTFFDRFWFRSCAAPCSSQTSSPSSAAVRAPAAAPSLDVLSQSSSSPDPSLAVPDIPRRLPAEKPPSQSPFHAVLSRRRQCPASRTSAAEPSNSTARRVWAPSHAAWKHNPCAASRSARVRSMLCARKAGQSARYSVARSGECRPTRLEEGQGPSGTVRVGGDQQWRSRHLWVHRIVPEASFATTAIAAATSVRRRDKGRGSGSGHQCDEVNQIVASADPSRAVLECTGEREEGERRRRCHRSPRRVAASFRSVTLRSLSGSRQLDPRVHARTCHDGRPGARPRPARPL